MDNTNTIVIVNFCLVYTQIIIILSSFLLEKEISPGKGYSSSNLMKKDVIHKNG